MFCQPRNTLHCLVRIMLLKVSVLIATAACTIQTPLTEANWPTTTNTLEGLDIKQVRNVLIVGFTQIEAKALERQEMSQLVLAGASGITSLDSNQYTELSEGRLRTWYKGTMVLDLPQPSNQDVDNWVDALLGIIVSGRTVSPILRKIDTEYLYETIFDSVLTEFDLYSRYADRREARRNREARNGFGGIGIRYKRTPKGLTINSILQDSPAARTGILLGDVVVAINGKSVSERSFLSIREALRGPVSTVVSLSISRGDPPKNVIIAITRDFIVEKTVDLEINDDIAVIRVHGFNQKTAENVAEAIRQAVSVNKRQLPGIILDLRGTPGGLLDQAIAVSDLFMKQGRIVATRGRHPDSMQSYSATEGDITNGALIAVIVDGRSASASEIVAAAIQDTGRGLVVGTTSFGKGTVQTVVRLPNDAEITLTWSRFYAPAGYAIQGLGILPIACTSSTKSNVQGILALLSESASQITRQFTSWYNVDTQETKERAQLRSFCPAKVRLDGSLEREVARVLISDPLLYDSAIELTSESLALTQ